MLLRRFIFKPIFYLVLALVFLFSSAALMKKSELVIMRQVEALEPIDPVPEMIRLKREGKICQALEYADYFKDSENLVSKARFEKLHKELARERSSYSFRTRRVIEGAIMGHGACPESSISALITDFLIIGDIRDLAIEEMKRFRGEDTDEFIEALAGVGILLSAATYASGGGAAPIKGSLSALKVAKRMGKLSKALQRSLIRVFKQAKHTRSLRHLSRVSRSLYNLASTPNVRRNLLYVLSRSDSVADITRIERAARVYGKNTIKFMRLGGDESIDIARKFAGSKDLTRAMNRAVQYGEDGTRILRKAGPSRFLNYLRAAKYGARGIRTTYQGRVNAALFSVAKIVPEGALMITSFVSGFALLFAPFALLFRIGLMPRTRFRRV